MFTRLPHRGKMEGSFQCYDKWLGDRGNTFELFFQINITLPHPYKEGQIPRFKPAPVDLQHCFLEWREGSSIELNLLSTDMSSLTSSHAMITLSSYLFVIPLILNR